MDQKQYVILVDGMEKIPSTERSRLLPTLERLCGNETIRVIVTAEEDADLQLVMMRSRALGRLVPEDRRRILEHILQRMGKNLSADIKQLLLEKAEDEEIRDCPLWLDMAAGALSAMTREDYRQIAAEGDGMEAIRRRHAQIIGAMPVDAGKMAVFLLGKIGEAVSPAAEEAAGLIALSEKGLGREDLAGVLEAEGKCLRPLDLGRMLYFFPGMFYEKQDGRIDIAHRVVRGGLRGELARSGKQERYAGSLAAYLRKNPDAAWKKKEYLRCLLLSGQQEQFLMHVAAAESDDERTLQTECLMDWLFDFQSPEEAGYLEQPGLWKMGIERIMGEAPGLMTDPEFRMQYAAACERPGAREGGALPAAHKGRVDRLLGAMRALSLGDAVIARKLTHFQTACVWPAWRCCRFEGREYSRRMMAALLCGFLDLTDNLPQEPSLAALRNRLRRQAAQCLMDTGFYKDREDAGRLLGWALTEAERIGEAEMYECLLLILRLQIDSGAPREEILDTYERACRILRVLEQRGCPERVLLQSRAGLYLWMAEYFGANDARVFVQIGTEVLEPVSEELRHLPSAGEEGAGALERREREAFALETAAGVHLQLSRMYSLVFETRRGGAGALAERMRFHDGEALRLSREVLQITGMTVSSHHLHFGARSLHMRMLGLLQDSEAYELEAQRLWNWTNRFRIMTGSRESLEDMAKLLSLLLENDQVLAPAKEQYRQRRAALLQRVMIADPPWRRLRL